MSNGESKIAESKARLCYGFAIALRALFLGILCYGILCPLIATLAPLARNDTQNLEAASKQQQHANSLPILPNHIAITNPLASPF